MPFVRSIVAQWQPRNCDPMVDFLDSWAPLIPVWVLDNILEQLIFPKLQKEVGPQGEGPGLGQHLSAVAVTSALACSSKPPLWGTHLLGFLNDLKLYHF